MPHFFAMSSLIWRELPLTVCAFVAGNVVVVERRGRREALDPKRQIEIRTVLESVPDAVVIVNTEVQIIDANRAAVDLSGLERERVVGMTVGEFARHMGEEEHERNVVPFRKPIVTRALAGEEVREERRMVKHPPTGKLVELLVSANPIRNEKGEILGALLVARDVTELANLQQRLADIERHQAIGHVAAGIAHDFNNTLQTIGQAVAVLQMSPDRSPEERKVFLDMIQNAVRQGAEVIARIRDYLRSGTNATREVNVRALLEDAIELTRPMWQSARTVQVETELKPTPLVQANEADLRRVFTNLIINSLQAMPDGGKLVVGCEEKVRDVHVWVRDTGTGIGPEAKKQVFNPYFTTKPGGTGLGLSGAQKILLGLGGNISFESEPGKGTQFDLFVPKASVNGANKESGAGSK
jgi:two-component system, cell cycle sensor histidine kinase and response regulator CckA